MVDTPDEEALISKTHEEVHKILKELTYNNYQWPFGRAMQRKTNEVFGFYSITTLATFI
jgi:hypothetical protein